MSGSGSRLSTVVQAVRASVRFQDNSEPDDGSTRGPNSHFSKRPHTQPQTHAPTFGAAPNNNQQYGSGASGAPNNLHTNSEPWSYVPPSAQQNPNHGYVNPTQYLATNQQARYNQQQWISPYVSEGPQYNPGQSYSSNPSYTNAPQMESQSAGHRWQYFSSGSLSHTGGYDGHDEAPAHSPRLVGRTTTGYGNLSFEPAYSPGALARAHTVPLPSSFNPAGRNDVIDSAGSTAARRSRDGSYGASSSESVPSGYGSDNYGRGSAESQPAMRQEICYNCTWPFDETGRCGCSLAQ